MREVKRPQFAPQGTETQVSRKGKSGNKELGSNRAKMRTFYLVTTKKPLEEPDKLCCVEKTNYWAGIQRKRATQTPDSEKEEQSAAATYNLKEQGDRSKTPGLAAAPGPCPQAGAPAASWAGDEKVHPQHRIRTRPRSRQP